MIVNNNLNNNVSVTAQEDELEPGSSKTTSEVDTIQSVFERITINEEITAALKQVGVPIIQDSFEKNPNSLFPAGTIRTIYIKGHQTLRVVDSCESGLFLFDINKTRILGTGGFATIHSIDQIGKKIVPKAMKTLHNPKSLPMDLCKEQKNLIDLHKKLREKNRSTDCIPDPPLICEMKMPSGETKVASISDQLQCDWFSFLFGEGKKKILKGKIFFRDGSFYTFTKNDRFKLLHVFFKAVAAISSIDIVHGDLKLENLMFTHPISIDENRYIINPFIIDWDEPRCVKNMVAKDLGTYTGDYGSSQDIEETKNENFGGVELWGNFKIAVKNLEEAYESFQEAKKQSAPRNIHQLGQAFFQAAKERDIRSQSWENYKSFKLKYDVYSSGLIAKEFLNTIDARELENKLAEKNVLTEYKAKIELYVQNQYQRLISRFPAVRKEITPWVIHRVRYLMLVEAYERLYKIDETNPSHSLNTSDLFDWCIAEALLIENMVKKNSLHRFTIEKGIKRLEKILHLRDIPLDGPLIITK